MSALSAQLLAWVLFAAPPRLAVWTVPWSTVPDLAAPCVAEVHPFAFAFDEQDRPVPLSPTLLRESSRRRGRGARVIAAVVNDIVGPDATAKELKSPRLVERLLAEPARRRRHVRELVALAADAGVDGVEIDYERVPPALWPAFRSFVDELARELHLRGKQLQVDVEGALLPTAQRPPERVLRDIAARADRVNVMMYYERGPWVGAPDGTGPGSSLPWLTRLAGEVGAILPRARTTLVFSLAATDWALPLASAARHREVTRLPRRRADELARIHRVEIHRDATLGSPRFRYEDGGRPHELWFEDEESLRLRIAVAERAGATQVGVWYVDDASLHLAEVCSSAGRSSGAAVGAGAVVGGDGGEAGAQRARHHARERLGRRADEVGGERPVEEQGGEAVHRRPGGDDERLDGSGRCAPDFL